MVVANVLAFFQQWFDARLDDALAKAEWAVQLAPAFASYHSTLGVCYLELGRLDDARKILDEAVERDPARMHRDLFTTSNLAMYAMVAAALHNEAAATVLSEQLAVQTGPVVWNGIITMGALDVYRGILAGALGRHEEADALLAAGVELNDRIGATVGRYAPGCTGRRSSPTAAVPATQNAPRSSSRRRGQAPKLWVRLRYWSVPRQVSLT